jgi:hypothetical protein
VGDRERGAEREEVGEKEGEELEETEVVVLPRGGVGKSRGKSRGKH